MRSSDTRPTIALDCDDTLVNLREPMMAMLNRFTDLQWHWRDWGDYQLHRRYRLTPCRLLNLIIEHRVLEHARPEPGAAGAIRQLRAAGYRVEIWTARRFHPQALAITAETLAPLGIEREDIRLFRLTASKARQMGRLPDVQWLVDDCPRHANAMHRRGRGGRVVVPSMPWNRRVSAKRLPSLDQIVDHIQAHGLAFAS